MQNNKDTNRPRDPGWPDWFDGKRIDEVLLCRQFIASHRLAFTGDSFFTPRGRLMDDTAIRKALYRELEHVIKSGLSKRMVFTLLGGTEMQV